MSVAPLLQSQSNKTLQDTSDVPEIVLYSDDDDTPAVAETLNRTMRQSFQSGITLPLAKRLEVLKAFRRMVFENEEELCEAVQQDLGKCRAETVMTELSLLHSELEETMENLASWVAPEKPSSALVFALDKPTVRHEPLGTCLIFGAWNYPLQLTMVPMIGALAGGNTVVVKPSDVAANSARVMATLMAKYLDPRVVRCITGEIRLATELLAQRWDHIFYTGNGMVARIVMRAAAEYLTPVVLELGGKSPCFVDRNCNLDVVANRVMWGKTVNAGQTCVAPDYVLCDREVEADFVDACRAALQRLFGDGDIREHKDYPRIVAERHVKRLVAYLEDGEIALGGEYDVEARFMAPTLLRNVDKDSAVMTEEIFGPILPIVPYDTLEDAVHFVNSRDQPLALYVFSQDDAYVSSVLDNTRSGGASVNDVITYVAVSSMPFGGTGPSGMGQYHGKFSFDTFTHRRSMLNKNQNRLLENVNVYTKYQPYSERKLNLVKMALGYPTSADWSGSHWKRNVFVLLVLLAIAVVLVRVFGPWEWLVNAKL